MIAMQDSSDKSLLRRVKSGEEDAATELYLRYAQRLIQLARTQTPADVAVRIDPEDVVQSVFRTFFRRAAGGSYDIPEGEHLWKLLLVISLHKVRSICSFHRADKRDVSNTVPLNPIQSSSARTQDSAYAILDMTIRELLADQPAIYTTVISLRIEGNDVAEIAKTTKRSKRTVERVLQQFRQKLASVIQDACPEVGRDERSPD